MPATDGGGGGRRRPPRGGNNVPVYNGGDTDTGSSATVPSGGGSGTSGTGSGGSGGSGSGRGSGGGGDPYGYRRKAGQQYVRQANNLQAQADALLQALRRDFKHGLKIRLRNERQDLRQGDVLLMEGYRDRVGSLAGSVKDNEIAEGAQTNAARTNMLREKASAVSEATMQGAGESDMLASQQMSLRNWNANQNEVNRSLFDTLRSVNSSLTDLNVDTKGARAGLRTQYNADRELLWTNYYNQRSEALTQLGNIYGQQADLLSQAQEYGVGSGGKDKKRKERMADTFSDASTAAGEAWVNPGIPRWLRKWEGRDDFQSDNNQSKFAGRTTTRLDKKPEGATLREW